MKKWNIPNPLSPEIAAALQDYHPVMRQILVNRGIFTAEAAHDYFYPHPRTDEDLMSMHGMRTAAERVLQAISQNEKIAIYGDYDVDGVTATAVLVEALTYLGAAVSPYIPDRFEEGYGINREALDKLKADGTSLVISVDCGVRSIAEAEYSRTIGLDLIITDHHTPLPAVPDAVAVIDAKLENDVYPYKYLAGVGVAYKLARCLFILTNRLEELGTRWLDLLAIGTIADMAPLDGENRSLVRAGLDVIHTTDRVGLITLCQAAGVNPQAVDAGSIGFILGPRLNASGRLERAMISYNLLVATDADEARQLAHELNELNQKRQEETRTVVEKSIQLVDASGGPGLVVFAISSEFNEGIVGLAAARVMEKYYRPAVVGTDQGETIRCSCRSIPELDITAVLDECANLLLHHGGHAAAAGFTVLARDFPALRQRIEAIAARKLAGLDLVPTLSAEMVVKLTDLGPALFRALQDLQPTGYGNRAPAFIVRGLRSRSTRTVGQDKRHLKLWLTDGFLPINAIAFGFGFMEAEFLPDTRADFLFTYEKNEYNGTVDFQMVVKDIQIQSP